MPKLIFFYYLDLLGLMPFCIWILFCFVMASYNAFSQLPRLVIDADNASGSFGKWLKKLAARLAEINMGTENDEDSNVVPKLSGEIKLLALLKSVSCNGIDVLESQGFELSAKTEGDYIEAIELLKRYYGKKGRECSMG